MTFNTFEIASRAERRRRVSQNPGLFGDFVADLGFEASMKLAFTVDRYAYVGSPLALTLWCTDGQSNPMWEPFTDLTVNYRAGSVGISEIVVKTYTENACVRAPLLETGYFEDTGKRIPSGFAELEIWRITQKFVDAFDVVHPEEVAA